MENNNMENNAQSNNNNMMMLLVGGVVVVVVVAVIVVLFVLGGDDESGDTSDSEQTTPQETTNAPVAPTPEAVENAVSELRANYIREWQYISPQVATSEDGNQYHDFISPVSDANPAPDTILRLQVGEDASKGVFSVAQINFLVSSYSEDSTDEVDALATMRSVFDYNADDIQEIQAEIDNLVAQFSESNENESSIGTLKNTEWVLQVGNPEDGSAAAAILQVSVR